MRSGTLVEVCLRQARDKPIAKHRSQALSATKIVHITEPPFLYDPRTSFSALRSPLFAQPSPILSRTRTLLVGDPPFLKPFKMPPLLIVTHHTKYNRPKQDEQPDDQEVKYPIECPLDSPVLSR